MLTHRFGRKLKLPSTIAIKHQIRMLMFEDALKNTEAAGGAEAEGAESGVGRELTGEVPAVALARDGSIGVMHATRAAVEEGILPGGGVALLRATKVLEGLKGHNEDQRHGIDIVRKALSWPARQIAENAGDDGSIVVGKILENDTYAYGYDAQNGEYGNMVSKGIIDPTKVVRVALQGAASVAGLLITTEAMVAELPKKESAPPMPGGGGMGGMGGMDF